MKFIIALFFMACYSQITKINMETNPVWMTSQQGLLNYTYMITGSNQQYLSVLITLSEPNSNFMLVSKSGSAVIDFNQQFTQGITIDIISAQENRLTRNLNIDISKNILPIYISTFDNSTKSKHEIIIKSSDKKGCPNDCSGQGECLYYGCKCFKNYVGNDCHQIANEINGTEENQFLLKDNATYFYFLLDEYQGKNGEIKFSTLDESQIKIYLFKSKSLAYPSYSESQFDKNQFEQNTLTNQNSQIIQFQVIEQIGINNCVVFVALVENNNITLILKISFNSNDETSLADYAIALIVVLPLLFILFLVFLIYRINESQKENKRKNGHIPNNYDPQPITYLNINQIQTTTQNTYQNSRNLEQHQSLVNNQILDGNNYGVLETNVKNQTSDLYEKGNSDGTDILQLNPNSKANNVENGNGNNDNHDHDNDVNLRSIESQNNNQGNQQKHDICFICKYNLVDVREQSETTCKHIFHKDCLKTWVQDHQECPECQARLFPHNSQAENSQLEGLVRFDID